MKEALSLSERASRVWVCVDEDVAVIESCHETNVWGAENPVSKHITGNIANSHD